ncbi:MAG: transposase [Proteobacteria bacterium]|nr:transposase [Desulfobulbaceae bacterium]MBU4154350.1 transposase [Pseudomonadota bacterium]
MSEKKKPVEYTAEFRESAVKLAVESAHPISQTAKELGVNKNTLYTWIGQFHRPVKNYGETVADEHIYDEVKRLRLETRRLKEERDILKKAAAYFVRSMA